MKLVIQIPCYNEAGTITRTLRDLPDEIPGIEIIETLVIDDGSTDGTVETALAAGVDHVVQLGNNRGLATAFHRGVEYALLHGADVVVNTDGDNQYCGRDIARLVAPVVANQADMVVGCRPIKEHPEFSPFKKALQRLGSWTLRRVSRTTVRDAASGFRAFSRETCQRLFIYTRFSYCMETLIQAGNMGLRVESVDIDINPSTRPSRLHRGDLQYLHRSGATILSMFVLYRPGRFFFVLGLPFVAVALFLGLRFLYLRLQMPGPDPDQTFIPTLVAMLLIGLTGFLMFALGVLGEILKSQRQLTQENLYLLRRGHAIPSQERS